MKFFSMIQGDWINQDFIKRVFIQRDLCKYPDGSCEDTFRWHVYIETVDKSHYLWATFKTQESADEWLEIKLGD